MHVLFPLGFAWIRSALLALAVLLFGAAAFRLVIGRFLRWCYRASPQQGEDVVRRLGSPYVLLVLVSAANAFQGVFGSRADWWLGALLWPVLGVFVIESLRLGIVDSLVHLQRGKAVPKILRDIVFGLIYLLAVLGYLGAEFKIDLAPFLTTSAILSVVIGMALQDTLGNVFAGLAINLDRPFSLGDWVAVDGDVGQVFEITWRATKILTLRHELHIIPNNTISKAKVVNYQLPSTCYAETIDFTASYDAPPNRVRAIALAVAREVGGVRLEPAPELRLVRFLDSSVAYQIALWIDDYSRSPGICSEFQERLWYHFHRAGLEFPFPVSDVRLNDAKERSETRTLENLHALGRIDIIACMDPDSVARLAKQARVVHFAAKEPIIRQGEVGGSLYVIKHGQVTLSLDGHGEHGTKPLAILNEGDFFGEMSLLTGERRTASAYAASECELLVIDHNHFAALLEEHPEFMQRISHVIAERRAGIETARLNLAEAREHLVPAQRQDAVVEAATNEIFDRIRAFFKLS